MPNDDKSSNERLAFLADRMAILMVVCVSRTGSWNPWFREGMYEDAEGMGDEIRSWPQHKAAMDVIRNMLRRYDNEVATHRRQSQSSESEGRLAG